MQAKKSNKSRKFCVLPAALFLPIHAPRSTAQSWNAVGSPVKDMVNIPLSTFTSHMQVALASA